METSNRSYRSGITFFSTTQQQNYSWFLLVVFILLLYVPFLGNRVVRPAGDDKVYTNQMIEMERVGNWFLQRLLDEPNYHKGPLHYILLRIGSIVFDHTMWATVWMNLVWVIIGSLAVGALVHRRLREFDGWSFFSGASFALCSAIYSHVFASQMEVGLAALFALGLYFLDTSGPGRGDIRFWVVCGIAGLLKSPLHAFLLGMSGILFWTWQGELLARVKDPRAWFALFLGILTCVVPFLPAFLLDREVFLNTYVLRETFHKPANGAPWHYPVIPFFTYGLMPWTLPAIVAYFDGISRLWRKSRNVKTTPGARRLMQLGICLILPSVAFFIYHPYRGQNYNTPAIAGLILLVSAIWATRSETWIRFYNLSLLLTALLFIVVAAALTYLTNHYEPLPFWWPSWLLPLVWVGALLTARGVFREGVTLSQVRPAALARRCIWFFWALGSLLSVLGEREMIDIKLRLAMARANSESIKLSYWNLHQNIWNEWGYLNFMIRTPVWGIHNYDQLRNAIKGQDLLLIPGDKFLTELKVFVEKEFVGYRMDIQPWRRWRTKGKNLDGIPTWKESWEKRDLSLLENKFYMVKVLPPDA